MGAIMDVLTNLLYGNPVGGGDNTDDDTQLAASDANWAYYADS